MNYHIMNKGGTIIASFVHETDRDIAYDVLCDEHPDVLCDEHPDVLCDEHPDCDLITYDN